MLIGRYQELRCWFASGRLSRRNCRRIRSILAFPFCQMRYYRPGQWPLLAKLWPSKAIVRCFTWAAGIIALASFIINNREIFIHLISITSNILFYASLTMPLFLYRITGNNRG
jgi:hypothetical protein